MQQAATVVRESS